jgi:menaquinone-dependent protoporphyrinogen oxidase
MTSQILVAYATRYGSTQEVAEAVAETLRERGLEVDVQPARDVRSLDSYSAVVVGAALYMYRWHKEARRFLSRHRKALAERPVAIFTLGPVHEPRDEEEWEGSREQLEKQLANVPWLEPVAVELFGGKFDPDAFRGPVKWFAGAEPASDARDWDAIRAWASDLAAKLETP